MPIPLNPYYQENFVIPESAYINAFKYYEEAITLPFYPSMSESQIENVINSVKEIIK